MLRLHRVLSDNSVAGWHDDLLIGLNAAMALAHLRILAEPEALTQFQALLGPDWVVYQTNHTLGLEKGAVKIVLADLLDRDQSFEGAPAQLIEERLKLGMGIGSL